MQVIRHEEMDVGNRGCGGTQFASFTGTKVQILTLRTHIYRAAARGARLVENRHGIRR
jgi:hypothetical protein